MNKMLSAMISFAVGVFTGALLTHLIERKSLENEISEEVTAVREHYDSLKGDLEELASKYKSDEDDFEEEPEPVEVVTVQPKEEPKREPTPIPELKGNRKLYAISPEQFRGEKQYYDKVELTYYEGDNTLANGDDEVMDIQKTIGLDALKQFGKYEEDVVHIRNDKLGIDYEVVLDERRFIDYLNA